MECENGNVEVQWNNIKECMLNNISDSVGKVEKRAKKKNMDYTGNDL